MNLVREHTCQLCFFTGALPFSIGAGQASRSAGCPRQMWLPGVEQTLSEFAARVHKDMQPDLCSTRVSLAGSNPFASREKGTKQSVIHSGRSPLLQRLLHLLTGAIPFQALPHSLLPHHLCFLYHPSWPYSCLITQTLLVTELMLSVQKKHNQASSNTEHVPMEEGRSQEYQSCPWGSWTSWPHIQDLSQCRIPVLAKAAGSLSDCSLRLQ